MDLRIGHGYDIHRIVPGRPLVVGGVRFDTDYGLDGHSDADCATHAVCDALLGAAVLTISKTWLQDLLPHIVGQAGNFEVIVFGVLMVVILQRAPDGLWPAITRHVPLRTPSTADVAELLVESYGVDAAMAAFAARASQGHIGRARALARDEHARLRRLPAPPRLRA